MSDECAASKLRDTSRRGPSIHPISRPFTVDELHQQTDVRSCLRKTACLSKHSRSVIVRSATTFDSRTLLVKRSAPRCWCPASFRSCNQTIDQPRHKIHRFIELSVPLECLRTSFHSPCADHSVRVPTRCQLSSSIVQPNAKIPRRTQFALLGSRLLCKDSLTKIE